VRENRSEIENTAEEESRKSRTRHIKSKKNSRGESEKYNLNYKAAAAEIYASRKICGVIKSEAKKVSALASDWI